MEHTEQNKTPLDLIQQEVEKAKRAPKKVGLLSVKPANDWIVDSLNSPDPKTFFHDLIVQYENTVIFAASNVGKSILAIQIAEHIARTEKILYIDLELSSKQFQMRYSDTYGDYAFARCSCGGQLRKRSCNCIGLPVLGGAAWRNCKLSNLDRQ